MMVAGCEFSYPGLLLLSLIPTTSVPYCVWLIHTNTDNNNRYLEDAVPGSLSLISFPAVCASTLCRCCTADLKSEEADTQRLELQESICKNRGTNAHTRDILFDRHGDT